MKKKDREKRGALDRKAQQYVKELRALRTPAEQRLINLLEARRVSFVFQSWAFDVTSGRMYIADFRIRKLCNKTRLYVELDGSSHDSRAAYDRARDRWFVERRDAIVLRFPNAAVFIEPDAVMAKIMSFGPSIRTARRNASVA